MERSGCFLAITMKTAFPHVCGTVGFALEIAEHRPWHQDTEGEHALKYLKLGSGIGVLFVQLTDAARIKALLVLILNSC